MKEPIELTPEDRQRIEKEGLAIFPSDVQQSIRRQAAYREGAEYATKYEREQASTMEDISKRRIEYLHEQLTAQAERIKQLEADLLDALDLKQGKGPTALTMLQERIKELEAALNGFIEDVEFHPSLAAREHYKPLVIKGKAALNSKSNG